MLLKSVLDNMVPISEFNKGKGAKIIEDVKESGFKIIVKNNHPEAVLITAEEYSKLMAIKEDYDDLILGTEAQRRMAHFDPETAVSHKDLLSEFGITEEELQGTDVDIR